MRFIQHSIYVFNSNWREILALGFMFANLMYVHYLRRQIGRLQKNSLKVIEELKMVSGINNIRKANLEIFSSNSEESGEKSFIVTFVGNPKKEDSELKILKVSKE